MGELPGLCVRAIFHKGIALIPLDHLSLGSRDVFSLTEAAPLHSLPLSLSAKGYSQTWAAFGLCGGNSPPFKVTSPPVSIARSEEQRRVLVRGGGVVLTRPL